MRDFCTEGSKMPPEEDTHFRRELHSWYDLYNLAGKIVFLVDFKY